MTPEERELQDILTGIGPFYGPSTGATWKDTILAWHKRHPAPQPRVSRESVEQAILPHSAGKTRLCSCNQTGKPCNKLVDDILALFGVREERKEWCEHIQHGDFGWRMKDEFDTTKVIYDSNHWKLCPICGKGRPE